MQLRERLFRICRMAAAPLMDLARQHSDGMVRFIVNVSCRADISDIGTPFFPCALRSQLN
jgi:hypothetical protein